MSPASLRSLQEDCRESKDADADISMELAALLLDREESALAMACASTFGQEIGCRKLEWCKQCKKASMQSMHDLQ